MHVSILFFELEKKRNSSLITFSLPYTTLLCSEISPILLSVSSSGNNIENQRHLYKQVYHRNASLLNHGCSEAVSTPIYIQKSTLKLDNNDKFIDLVYPIRNSIHNNGLYVRMGSTKSKKIVWNNVTSTKINP